MLYPLKFIPIYKPKVWGGDRIAALKGEGALVPAGCGESWEISALQGDVSVVSNGFLRGNDLQDLVEVYMGELVGDSIFERYGCEFPILLKVIDARENLSLQVHPDAATAMRRHHSRGKTELWYVLAAGDDSHIVSGFGCEATPRLLQTAIAGNTLSDIVNTVQVSAGEAHLIPAGRLHSLGSGCMVAEIQETADITYRVYDYGRTDRELHVDLATDVIDYHKTNAAAISFAHHPDTSNKIVKLPCFTVNFLSVMNPIVKDYYRLDSFVLYFCINGRLSINCNGENTVIARGETVLIPAEIHTLNLVPMEYTEMLEIYIEADVPAQV